jgi:hypothetical protein
MTIKKEITDKGLRFSDVMNDFGFSHRYIQGLIKRGELKLNDYDRIDVNSYLEFKKEWDNKPDWMKKK